MEVVYRIRPFEESDIKPVMDIELTSFIAPWTEEQFLNEYHQNEFANIGVIEMLLPDSSFKVVGFYDYWVTFDSATIAQIAVHPSYRRNGLASKMMKEILDECYAKRVVAITLEVRENNEKARKFYIKSGFEEVLLKPNYYSNGDNAIYMVKEVEL